MISSNTLRHFSRARMPFVMTVSAPSSIPVAPRVVQCELTRLTSIIAMRMRAARRGACTPSSRSIAMQYAVSVNIDDR